MKLKLLREHYRISANKVWVPKRAYSSRDEIREVLGFDINASKIYKCKICGALHTASHPLREKVG